MKALFANEFKNILYKVSLLKRPGSVAVGLQSLAYKLEKGVRPTRGQRERINGVMKQIPDISVLWSDYSVRLWYYIAAAQLKDAKLALTLNEVMQKEEDVHLCIWSCLAADQAASSEFAFDGDEASRKDLLNIQNVAQAIGREYTNLFPLMQSVLRSGFGILQDKATINFDSVQSDDLNFLLLALGRGQLKIDDTRLERYFHEAVMSEGIRHTDPTIAEYSLWAGRVRNLSGPISYSSLSDIPCLEREGVKHAAYRILTKDLQSRNNNKEFLRYSRNKEDEKGRLSIAQALTTKPETYDGIITLADDGDLDDALNWHSHENDEATGDRLFDFLVRNSRHSQDSTEYIISELEASGRNSNRYVNILNLRIRDLSPDLVKMLDKSNQKMVKQDSQFSLLENDGEATIVNAKNGITNFIVVAAVQELEAVRAYNRNNGVVEKREQTLALRDADIITLQMADDRSIDVGIILAPRKGSESMTELLGELARYETPRWVIMVGMMAGVPGASKLLDVMGPQTIFNAQAVGTKDERITVEPNGSMVDPTLHSYLHSMDKAELKEIGIRLITHKHTVTVAAKMDDWLHELSQKILAVDNENITGLEMEGWAIVQRQNSQARSEEKTGFIMIKGVADYAGGSPDPAEVEQLKNVPGLSELMDNPDPTNSPNLKKALQSIATSYAYEVALRLIKRVNR